MGAASGTADIARARPSAPWTTGAVTAISGATVALAVGLCAFAGPLLNEPAQVAAAFAIAAVDLALAAIVARAARGDLTAALLAALGMFVVVTNAIRDDATAVLTGGWMLLYAPLALILLVVPDGRLSGRGRGWIAGAAGAVVVAFMAVAGAQTAWPETAAALSAPTVVLLALFLAVLIACAVSPFARYRGANELERMRLRWVMVAGLSLPLTLLLCWASYLVLGRPDLVVFGLVVMLLAIPAGVTIALTRPQLFDVDRATVSVVAAVALLGAALAVLSVAGLVTGEHLTTWPPVAAAVATGATILAVAIAFPFVRRGCDRMLYPERARAVGRLRRLSAQVDRGTAVPEDVEAVLREALRDPGLIVAYRRVADGALVGLDGASPDCTGARATIVPVRAHGDDIGALVPSATRVKRPAAAVARAAAPLVYAARSRAQLTHANAELEASRARLVRAGYEVRCRIERDLHDGTQQRLVAVGMRLRVLQRSTRHDPELTVALDAAVAELSTAVAELRQIAHGLRPSALDDGLAAALAHLTRTEGTAVELDVRADGIPDAVATTAYYVVSEAVTNALRHAGASRVRVAVCDESGMLRVRVTDDGRGGAVARPTGGLTGLSDRVAALGGTWRVDSPIGAGTTVEAVLPCAW